MTSHDMTNEGALFMLGKVRGSGRVRHRIHIIRSASSCLVCQSWGDVGGTEGWRASETLLPSLQDAQAFMDTHGWRVEWMPNHIFPLRGIH